MPKHTDLLDILLEKRNISKDDRDHFLNPSFDEHVYDPFLMKDMERVCVRIFEAIEAKEKILIYSDYDCDGIPASVMMHDFFNKINYTNFSIYIPDRHDEGYGLHNDAIDKFINDGVNLLITFDLGITAVEEVAKAQENGIDVIITDHHLPQEEIPRAYGILNPKQNGCNYPDKMLCGAGVAFKLIQGLIKKYGEYWKINKGWEKWLLDMVSVATLSDQVPLLDENRVFAFYGLKVLQKGRRPGLVELFKKSSVDISKLNEEDITFTLAPRINAASRMDDPMKAFEMLATKDLSEAKALSDHLSKINDNRKITVAHIMKEVKSTLNKREQKSVIVIGNPNWRIGVLGIVASKIVDEYKKPAFVWGSDGSGDIKGSCRLPTQASGSNLVEMMTSLPENSLLSFGGHKGAGGFSVSHEEIHFLEERLSKVFTENETQEINNDYCVDANILIDDVNNDNYNIIKRLAPFGISNPKPTFLIKNICVSDVKEFGKDKNHLELSFKNNKNKTIKAISFFKTRFSFGSEVKKDSIINIIVNLEKNTFAGKDELRLRIIDII